jgi:hypothetical protein
MATMPKWAKNKFNYKLCQELNAKNKFNYKLGPRGYKATMPKWAKKEQELHDAGISDPLEGCTVCTRN